jgi:predicted DNA-binding transcriptional regulator YafY
VIDPAGWDRPARRRFTPKHLEDVQRAVIEAAQLSLGYVARDGTPSTRTVQPLGLAAKGSSWYLVADTDAGMRTFRVDRITAADQTGESFERPADFDLTETWRLIAAEIDERRAPLRARALADPEVVPWCRGVFGTRVRIGPPVEGGRVELELRGHGAHPLAFELAGFGAAIEVVDPPEVREALASLGEALVETYRVSAPGT